MSDTAASALAHPQVGAHHQEGVVADLDQAADGARAHLLAQPRERVRVVRELDGRELPGHPLETRRHGLEVVPPGAVLAPPAELGDLGAQRGQGGVAVGVGHVARDHDRALVLPALVDQRVELLEDPLGLALGADVVEHEQVHLGEAPEEARGGCPCSRLRTCSAAPRTAAASSRRPPSARRPGPPWPRAGRAWSCPCPPCRGTRGRGRPPRARPTSAMKRRTCRIEARVEVGVRSSEAASSRFGRPPRRRPPMPRSSRSRQRQGWASFVSSSRIQPPPSHSPKRQVGAPARGSGQGAQHQPCPFWADGASAERSRYMLAKRG